MQETCVTARAWPGAVSHRDSHSRRNRGLPVAAVQGRRQALLLERGSVHSADHRASLVLVPCGAQEIYFLHPTISPISPVSEVAIPRDTVLVTPRLKYCVQLWSPQHGRASTC